MIRLKENKYNKSTVYNLHIYANKSELYMDIIYDYVILHI
jgi:hypothetical protein